MSFPEACFLGVIFSGTNFPEAAGATSSRPVFGVLDGLGEVFFFDFFAGFSAEFVVFRRKNPTKRFKRANSREKSSPRGRFNGPAFPASGVWAEA